MDCSRDIKLKISEICSLLDVDGIRGDMVINRASRALVALEGRTEVALDDVAKVIGLCLNHRCDLIRLAQCLYPLLEDRHGSVARAQRRCHTEGC